MKKIITATLLAFFTIATASAQFKIHSDGKIAINTTATPNCPISINHPGNSDFYMSYQGNKPFLYAGTGGPNTGSSFILYPYTSTSLSVAVSGLCYLNSIGINPNLIGVGIVGRTQDIQYPIGTLGYIKSQTVGAGVMGASSDTIPFLSLLDKKYAGLFHGDVKVTGNLTVNGSINGSIASPSAPESGSVTMQEMAKEKGTSTVSLLAGLDAYAYRQDVCEEDVETTYETVQLSDSTTITLASADKDIRRQDAGSTHYALDASQLEKTFPALVSEMSDGTKAINYVEMVPLLVQCINELNARIQELEGVKQPAARKAPATTALSKTTLSQAILYQNTPNPFTAQTEIRFSLPDDAPASFIYIFDMQGKMQKQIPVDPSMQSVTINGYELQPGIYLCSLVVGGQEIETKRMILSK